MTSRNFRRVGSFIIDASIIGMLYQIITAISLRFITYSFTNIFYDSFVIIFYALIYVVVAVGYQYGCFKLINRSLGKSLMSIYLVSEKGKKVNENEILKREFLKYYLSFVTIGGYLLWQGYQVLILNKQAYHELRSGIRVK